MPYSAVTFGHSMLQMLCTAFNFLKGSKAWATIECGYAVWYLGPIQNKATSPSDGSKKNSVSAKFVRHPKKIINFRGWQCNEGDWLTIELLKRKKKKTIRAKEVFGSVIIWTPSVHSAQLAEKGRCTGHGGFNPYQRLIENLWFRAREFQDHFWNWSFCDQNKQKTNIYWDRYPPGNQHIPSQGTFEDDFPFPKVGYVTSLEGIGIGWKQECSINMLGKPGGLLYPAFGLHAVKRKLVKLKIGKHHRKKLQFSSNSCWKLSFALCFIGFMMLQVIKKWSLGIYTHQLTDSQNLPRTFAPTFRVGSRKSPVLVVKEMLANSWRIMVDPIFFRGFWVFSSKTLMLLDDKNLFIQNTLHCSNTFLPWNALKIATKFWRGSWLNDLEPPRYLSIFFIFLHRKTVAKNNVAASQRRVFWYGLLAFNLASTAYDSGRVCFRQGGWTMLQKSWEWNDAEIFPFGRGKLLFFFRTNHFAFPWTLTFWLFSDCRFFGKSWKKYEEPFYHFSHMLHPSCENCGFALTGFQRTKTKSIQKPYAFLMDCNDISSFLTCFPLPFPCKVFSSCKFAMTPWFASADFYRIPFVASKPLIWRVFPNCLTSFISRWGNGGSPNSDSCNLILTACWHLQERLPNTW